MIKLSRRNTLGLAASLVPGVARAAELELDLKLVLAVDASGSVSTERFELQKQGYAQAFRDPRVLRAIGSLPSQAMAATMMQWTGPSLHVQVVPWTVLQDAASAGGFADRIAAAPRRLFGGGTSISGAIDEGRRLMDTYPPQALRRVIDISGDGANNNGRRVSVARDEAVADGVIINGLPILNVEPDLDEHYRNQVIGGPGSFLIAIDNYGQFAEAIVHKLVSEIADNGEFTGVAGRFG
jgi:hypothetical protein